jgi:hypothetical protein
MSGPIVVVTWYSSNVYRTARFWYSTPWKIVVTMKNESHEPSFVTHCPDIGDACDFLWAMLRCYKPVDGDLYLDATSEEEPEDFPGCPNTDDE